MAHDRETSVDDFSADLLHGGEQIARFLNVPESRVYYLMAQNHIPCFKLGQRWCARKSRLIEFAEQQETSTA